jgi:mono/diheme cytochrome c family protein
MRGEYEKRLADELADYNQPAIEKEARDDQLTYAEELAAGGKDLTKPPTAEEAIVKMKTEVQEFASGDWPDIRTETVEFITESWLRAEDAESREAVLITPTVPRVADSPESRERGRVLYSSDKTKCYTCHGPTGRGDGTSAEEFAKLPGSNDFYAQRGLHDTWGNLVPPRDLTRGQYRGGRRPIDLFCRISAGIKGTPMPAFGGTVLTDSDILDVVNYVMSLQFQESLSETKTMTADAESSGAAQLTRVVAPLPEDQTLSQSSQVNRLSVSP